MDEEGLDPDAPACSPDHGGGWGLRGMEQWVVGLQLHRLGPRVCASQEQHYQQPRPERKGDSIPTLFRGAEFLKLKNVH